MNEGAGRSETDAIVVGAGAAGLAAADTLVRAGLRVVVLEARNRPGGRILTDYRLGGGIPFELGAQMVHGARIVTHGWLAREGLTTRRYPTMQRSRIVLDRRVARYPWLFAPFHPIVGTRAAWEGTVGVSRSLLRYAGPDRSLRRFLDERPVPPAARQIVQLLHAHTYGVDLDSIGVRGPAAEDALVPEAFGFHNFLVREGYSELVRRLAARLGDRIQYEAPVGSVHRGLQGAVARVTGGVGSVEREVLAPGVIVTVPLPLLQARSIAFDPPLPPEKLRAIDRIGFSHVYALHLKLRERRIRRRLGDFAMVYGGTASSFYRARVGLGEGTEFLTAFTVGREALRRVELPEEEIVRATVDEWDTMMPEGLEIGGVDGAVLHRWSTDRWTRGGYSYLPPGATIDDRRELARPVDGRLFFAGEATNTEGHPATVAGAIDSGVRAARELMDAQAARTDVTASGGEPVGD